MIDVGAGTERAQKRELLALGIDASAAYGLELRDWKEWVRMHMLKLVEKKRAQLAIDLHRLKQRHYLFLGTR